jgi:NhaP-type Na+/H+ or K+/H+ antiporter/CRP-like cAMP-binding protein
MAGGLSAEIVFFTSFTILVSTLILTFRKKLRVPSTILMVLSGTSLRLITYYLPNSIDFYELADQIDGPFLLFVFIPPLIFETAISIEWYFFKRQFFQIFLLATTGVCISTILIASVTALVFIDHDLSITEYLIFGVIMSATDHVSVVAQLSEHRIENKLSNLIQGETLLNDATVLVLLKILGQSYHGSQIVELGIVSFLELTLGGLAIGLISAICMILWLRYIINEPILEVTVTIVTAYLAFYFADGTGIHFSGAIAVVTVGLAMSAFGKTVVSPISEHSMHTIWPLLSRNIEGLIFMVSGMIFARVVVIDNQTSWDHYFRYFAIFLLCYVCRAITMAIHYPILKRLGYGLTFKEFVTLSFSGLKGTITVILALIHSNSELVLGCFLITVMSIFTDSFLLKRIISFFEVEKISAVQENLLVQVTSALVHETYQEFQRLGESDDAKLSDWSLVHEVAGSKKLINSLFSNSKIGREILKKSEDSQNESEFEMIKAFSDVVMLKPDQILTEIRRRFLMMMKGIFWHTFEEGQCFRLSVLHCSKATNYSLDRESEPLDTWIELLRISIPKLYMRLLKLGSKIPGLKKISRRILYERLALTYDSALCFIHAHHEAVHFLKSMDTYFEGYKHHINTIIEESHHEVEACNHYIMDHITCNYPEVLRYVQTYKSCHSVLNVQRRLIEKLMHHGMINEAEYDKLANVLDESFKHLALRYVPRLPNTLEMVRSVFPHLPDEVLRRLASTASEVFFSEGDHLFLKGQAVNGGYIILKGCTREFSEDFEEQQTIGYISGAQHMTPFFETNITSSQAITATFALKIQLNIVEINVEYMKEFWLKAVSKIFMILRNDFVNLLDDVSNENINKFMSDCRYDTYTKGDIVNCISGGLLLAGELDEYKAYKYIPPGTQDQMMCNKDTVFLHLPSVNNNRTMSREKLNSTLIGKMLVQKSMIFQASKTIISAQLGFKVDSRSGENDTKLPERQFYSALPTTKYEYNEDDIKSSLLRVKTTIND